MVDSHFDIAVSDDDGDPFPLLLTLHGLKGSRDGLVKQHEHGDWDARFAGGACLSCFPRVRICVCLCVRVYVCNLGCSLVDPVRNTHRHAQSTELLHLCSYMCVCVCFDGLDF